MKTTIILSMLGIGLLAFPERATAGGGETNSSTNTRDRNSFSIIQSRNIFDPNRRVQTPRNTGPTVRRESFTLNGIMTYEGEGFAFFEGTGVQRGKVFKANETINRYKIAEIANNVVKLSATSNQFITLTVGSTMSRTSTGTNITPWQLTASPAQTAESTSSSSSSEQTNDSGTSAPISTTTYSGADSDIVARLKARREAEEKGSTGTGEPPK